MKKNNFYQISLGDLTNIQADGVYQLQGLYCMVENGKLDIFFDGNTLVCFFFDI